MKLLTISINRSLLCFLFVATTACAQQTDTETKAESSYTKLCNIYVELNMKRSSSTDIVILLGKRLQQEVPELSEVNHHIAMADPADVYDLYKQSAESATNKPWSCKAIKDFYEVKK